MSFREGEMGEGSAGVGKGQQGPNIVKYFLPNMASYKGTIYWSLLLLFSVT